MVQKLGGAIAGDYVRRDRRDIEPFRNGTHFLVAPLEGNANDLQNKLLAFFSFTFGPNFGYILTTFSTDPFFLLSR